ncbi:MAG: hypothetical protein AB1831_11330 [Pseudomonadota bacterium]
MDEKQTRFRGPIMERRLNHKLRERFDTAITLLQPTLARHPNPSDTAMYRVMQELVAAFPDLGANEIEALLVAVMRTLRERQEAMGPHGDDRNPAGRIAA